MSSKLKSNYLNRLDVRLTVYYTLILLGLFVLLAAFFLYRLNHNLIKQVDQILHDEAFELMHEIEEELNEPPEQMQDIKGEAEVVLLACQDFEKDITRRKYYPIYFRVLNDSGTLLYTSNPVIKKKPLRKLSFPSVNNKDNHYFSFKVPHRSPFRCYHKKFKRKGANSLIIQIVTATSRANKIYKNMLKNILRTLPVILLLSIAFGLYASRRPFEIIREMNKITKRITSKSLGQRLPVPVSNSEVKDLTETINSMLDRLERSFEEVRQFTSDVSHELRKPLSSVRGEMEVALLEQRDLNEYRELLSNCLERTNSLIKVVNDLFLISRFESNKETFNFESVNFSEMVREMHSFLLESAQEKHLDFTIDRNNETVLKADKTKLDQLLINIIDNAIKFTPEHGSVTLSLINKDGSAEFRVRDTGIGIPEEKLPKIFNRFYQVDDARSNLNSGSGLGLHICKRIAEGHHGDITVEKNTDKGVTFILTLPKTE